MSTPSGGPDGGTAGRPGGRPGDAQATAGRTGPQARRSGHPRRDPGVRPRAFAARGFGSTSVRAVAADAGVDPSLVHHYFGSKDDLFMAALQIPVDPRELLAPVIEQGQDGADERLLRTFLGVWDDPEQHAPADRAVPRPARAERRATAARRRSCRWCSFPRRRGPRVEVPSCGCPWWPARSSA